MTLAMGPEFTYVKHFVPATADQLGNQFSVNIQQTIVSNAQLFTVRPNIISTVPAPSELKY